MKKGLCKKVKAFSLCMVMAVGILGIIPAGKVQAKSGSGCIDVITDNDYATSKRIYTTYEGDETVSVAGISYDAASNTITFDNCKQSNMQIKTRELDSGLKIKISGDNAIGSLEIAAENSGDSGVSIEGKGSITINEKKLYADAIVVYGSGDNVLHIGEYVSVKAYAGTAKVFSGWADTEDGDNQVPLYTEEPGNVIDVERTHIEDASKAIIIDGTMTDKLSVESSVYQLYDKYLYVALKSGETTMKLAKSAWSGDESYYGVTDDTEDTDKYQVHSLILGDNSFYHNSQNANMYGSEFSVSKADFANNYEMLSEVPTSLPKGVASKAKVNNGVVETSVIIASQCGGLPYAKKNGVNYWVQHWMSGIDVDGDGKNEAEHYYGIYNTPSTGGGSSYTYDPGFGYIYTDGQAYQSASSFVNDYTGTARDTYVLDKGDYDENYEDLIAAGYEPVLEYGEYTHKVKKSPLVITAKPLPTAAINISADSYTKTEGDAAFSLNATTNEGAALTYASDNDKAAKVSAAGQVTIVGAGTAKITITASGEYFTTATKIVTVNVEAKTTEAPATEAPKTETPVTVATGTTTTDKTTGATYTVTASADGKTEVKYKASTTTKDKKVVIPSTVTVNGVEATVTSVADNAFAGNKTVTEVTIPATVEEIGAGAFKNCTKLKKMTIPKNVEKVGKNAFAGCSNLTTVNIKSTTITTIEQGAFKNCKKLTKVTVTKNVKTIGKEAFSGDKKLKTIEIKSTKIKKIGKNAFKGVPKTTTIKVPKKQKKAYTKLLKKAGFKGKVK